MYRQMKDEAEKPSAVVADSKQLPQEMPRAAEAALEETKSTLNIFAKIGYGFGHVYNDLCATIWFSYMLLFLKYVLTFDDEAGWYMMLGQIADAIFTTIIGVTSDRFSTKRNWHILGTVLVTISFPVLFVLRPDVLSDWGNIIYFSMFIVLFQCGWAIVQISHLAILPELSKTHNDRSELNTVRFCLSISSNITVFLVAWAVLQTPDRSEGSIGTEDFEKFRVI
jgi:Na+/melibiose symporter-like transporter